MRIDIKELIESAEEDLKLAKLALENDLYNSAAFHSHQCIEKFLKACLLYKLNNYPFIHSIARLLHKIIEIDEDFRYLFEIKAYKLDKYYTKTRYPPLLKITKEEAREAIEIAEKVRKFILKKLEKRL